MTNDDRLAGRPGLNQSLHVTPPFRGRGMTITGPFTIPVAALIESQHMEVIREMEADKVPTVCALVATVQEDQGRGPTVTPFQEVKPQPVGDEVPRCVSDG